MKTGEVAKILGVDAITVRRWIEREELNPFFSEGAKGEHGAAQRLLTESDVLVLNTVRALRTGDKVAEWRDIATYLESGERVQQFPQNAISADPRTIPLPQAEQSARAMATMAERDAALRKVNELESQLKEVRAENKELIREMMDLRQKIGKLEGLLEALRGKDE